VTRVKLYTTSSCPFCIRAKRLLEARGIPFEDIDVGNDDALREEIMQRTGRRTVPQIFIDERSVGGFEELAALDAAGKLAELHEPAA
jgi:glutaredoxin 3